MERDVYIENLKELEAEFTRKRKKLDYEFAMGRNPYTVGDIVTDHLGSIRTTRIRVMRGNVHELPQCVYEGEVLTKKMEPVKRGKKTRTVWQSNIVA